MDSSYGCLGIWTLVMTIVMLTMAYKSWVKPWRAARIRAHYPPEPGPDDAVSRREMIVRSAWRYNNWFARIGSLVAIGILLICWWFVLTHL